MKRAFLSAPNQKTMIATYKHPVIDRLLGRTTLEWDCVDGHKEKVTAYLRFTDFEGYKPSWYSISKLPFVLKTYLEVRKAPIMQKPVPFLTMDAIRFMDKLVQPGMNILEIGGGNSSLWFLKHGVNLTTYEHDREWASMLQNKVKQHPEYYNAESFTLQIMEGNDVLNDLEKLEDKHFDVLLVDCMNAYTQRTECIRIAKDKVKDGGWVILDNSDNPANWPADEIMNGKKMYRFTGYAAMGLFVCQTSFWRM